MRNDISMQVDGCEDLWVELKVNQNKQGKTELSENNKKRSSIIIAVIYRLCELDCNRYYFGLE